MQVIQIETFKFEDISIKCMGQVFGLFIAFISLYDVISE